MWYRWVIPDDMWDGFQFDYYDMRVVIMHLEDTIKRIKVNNAKFNEAMKDLIRALNDRNTSN